MRLGVDFGTTNSVVAFQGSRGVQVIDHRRTGADGSHIVEDLFPSVLARGEDADELLYGLEAEALGRRSPDRVLRSIKRTLWGYHDGATVDLSGQTLPLLDAVTGLLEALRRSAEASLGRPFDDDAPVVATVPANANGAQRWVTRKALLDAGWPRRLRLLDEPTAAAIEYVARAVRRRRGRPPSAERVLVYDLGGGTFDASIVAIDGDHLEVTSNGGLWRLGGDDVDRTLAELVAESAEIPLDALSPRQLRSVLTECRRAKESLAAYPRLPRRVLADLTRLGLPTPLDRLVRLDVREIEARLRPMLDETLQVVDEVIESSSSSARPAKAVLVGGSTLLPFVSRALEPRFDQVIRVARPFESVAIGAALSHEIAPSRVTHRLARSFGVLRVGGADHSREYLDVLFPRGTTLPQPGQLRVVSRGPYRPVHEIGVLRYLECATVASDGTPGRNRRDWRTVRFPYDPALTGRPRDADRPPRRRDDLDVRVTEEYLLDSDGIISVHIRRTPDGYSERHEVCG